MHSSPNHAGNLLHRAKTMPSVARLTSPHHPPSMRLQASQYAHPMDEAFRLKYREAVALRRRRQ
jgi:hypothetical protein